MKQTLLTVLLLGLLGCSARHDTTLEFRVAEDAPGLGLTEMLLVQTGERFYLHDEALVTQADVDSAFAMTQDDRSSVELILTPQGTAKFAELTEQNIGKRCGVILDGRLVSAPRIMAPILEGRVIVTGDFTESEAIRTARGLSPP